MHLAVWMLKLHAPVMDFHNRGLQLCLCLGNQSCMPRLWISTAGACDFVFPWSVASDVGGESSRPPFPPCSALFPSVRPSVRPSVCFAGVGSATGAYSKGSFSSTSVSQSVSRFTRSVFTCSVLRPFPPQLNMGSNILA